jgi:hypothetical protein
MAVIGKTGSYATTEAPQDNIMQAMQYVDQLEYRAKQDKAAQAKAKAQAKAEKEKEIVADLEKIKALPTGNRGYDAPVIEATTKLSEKYASYARDYANGKMSKTEFKVRSSHLLSQVSLINEKSKLVIDKYKTFEDLLKNDKLEKGFEDGAVSLGKTIDNGQIYPELDENDNIVMIAYDVDENGNKVIVEKNGLADFGNAKLNPTMKVDFQGEVKSFKENNKIGLLEDITDNIKIGKRELIKGSKTDNNIRSFAAARVQDPNFLRIAYRNKTGETKYDITDSNDIALAEDWVYNQIYNSYTDEINKDEAMGMANLGLGYARLKQDEKQKTTFGQTEVPLNITSAGYKPAMGYKGVSVTSAKPFPIIGGITLGMVNSYTVTTDGTGKKRIVAEVVYPDVKSSTLSPEENNAWMKFSNEEELNKEEEMIVSKISKGAENKVKVISLDDPDVYKLAVQMGFDNQNKVFEAAKFAEANDKSERKEWDDAYKKGSTKKLNNNPKPKIDY